jgi:chemosensory pili system protein ChpA (sensor histidine kinase/response regulator)
VELIESITTQLRRVMQPGVHVLPPGFIDRLADAIVSVEYYMETLQAGRSDPWYMLDNAQSCVQALEQQETPPPPTVPPLEPSAYAITVQIPSVRVAGAPDARAVKAAAPTLATSPAPKPVPVEHADPELMKLFIEEAHEELAKIQHNFPVWDQNPLERDSLVTARRSFHTLKGSGRMVGARDLGEFAWSIENLLNRLLDNTLTRSPPILETLRAAVSALPELVAQLENGTPVHTDLTAISSRAHALAAGRQTARTADGAEDDSLTDAGASGVVSSRASPAAAVPRAPAAASAATTPVAAAPPAAAADARSAPAAQPIADDTLRDIYARETAAHVATVRAYVAREAQLSEPHALPEELYRACHTLSGSSKMAQARHGIRLAEPLDHWLRRAFSSGAGLATNDLGILDDCMSAMESVATHLDEATGYFVNHWALLERIAAAEKALDQRIEAAESAKAPAAADAGGADAEQGDDLADFDPEVAAIFTDEATELIEASEQALGNWRSQPDSADDRLSLKRPLHTLKGGARMAGILPMGDLSHELESLVMLVEGGTVTANAPLFDAIQASLDELARMREQVANGRRVAPARAIIARLQGLARPGGAAGGPGNSPAAPPPPAATVAPPASAMTAPAPGASEGPITAEFKLAATGVIGVDTARVKWTQEYPLSDAEEGAPEEIVLSEEEPEPAAEEESTQPSASAAPAAAAAEAPAPADHATAANEARAHPEGAWTSAGAMSAVSPFARLRGAESHAEEGLAAPQPVPPGREPVTGGERQEMARVDADLLDQLLNTSGEASIARARLEQQLGSFDFNLGELSRTVTRLKEQLRHLEIETEAQILHKHEDEGGSHRSDFDPLELDRYSSIQQYSRALAETANDVASIQQLLENLAKDTQNLLQQQARTITELQNGLMRTRMVPFQRHVQRLARIVRQAAADTGKRAELIVEGASGELDRQVLERMLPPFEHMLRNAVVHGIEKPDERVKRGKPDGGRIVLELHREGAEVMVRLTDDGGGMNLKAIRDKAVTLGLIGAGQAISDEDAMQLILEPGFSTAGAITQQAGRGVGMDVVATEIKRLGGALHMETKAGEGTVFTIRLPLTLAISHALVVRTDEEYYALPLPTVEGVLRLSKAEVAAHLGRDASAYDYAGQKYRFQHLASFVGLPPSELPSQDVTIPVVLVRAGEHSTGLVADELVGSREIVVKSVGPQISSIRGISGATILGDGRIVIILDIGALVRAEWRARVQAPAPAAKDRADRRIFAFVVDDSITVRRVTQRLLERNGMRVLTARDGMDAVALLQDNVPDVILLDIEMPRMDGYEVAAHVRNDPRLKEVPIIMVTSRVGEKHRARAIELGVDDYLGKPYQEAQLLDAIAPLVERRRAGTGRNQAFGS